VATAGMSTSAADPAPFKALTVLVMVLVGVGGFAALLWVSAFAPDLRAAHSAGGHALSSGATGYSGLVQLAGATGRNPRIVRSARGFRTDDLLVISPELAAVPIGGAMARPATAPLLIILAKWATVEDADHPGWVRTTGLLPLAEPVGVMGPAPTFLMARRPAEAGHWLLNPTLPAAIRLRAPAQLQVIAGIDTAHSHGNTALAPLVTDGQGGIVLARLADRDVYVLSDPDLLSNQAMADEGAAASALALLDQLNGPNGRGIAFDVSMNGFDAARSPLRLLFAAPFVGGTVCLTLALLLAGFAAFHRFGPARSAPRAIAFGKAALVDNAALLVRKAGKEAQMGARYAEVMRQRARGAERGRFAELDAAARAATDRASLLVAARALHDWAGETDA